MRRALALIAVVLLLLGSARGAALAALYEWTDDSGVRHLTDDPNQVPERYRSRVKERVTAPPASPAPPPPSTRPEGPGRLSLPAPAPSRFTVKEPPPEWTRVAGRRSPAWRNAETGAGLAVESYPRRELPRELSDAALSEMLVGMLPIVIREGSRGQTQVAVVGQGPVEIGGKKLYQAVMNFRTSAPSGDVSGRSVLYLYWSGEMVFVFILFAPLGAYEQGHAVLREIVRTFSLS